MLRWRRAADRYGLPVLAAVLAAPTSALVVKHGRAALDVAALQAGLGLAFTVLLLWVWYRYLVRSDLGDQAYRTALVWALGGIVALLVLNLWFRSIEVVVGDIAPEFALTTSLATGALGGTIVGVSIGRSRHEHERREAVLADYRELFEQAEDGIIFMDPETERLTDVNPRMAEILGGDRDDLVGLGLGDVTVDDPAFDETVARDRIHSAIDGDPQRFEWSVERFDGRRRWVEISLKRTTIGDKPQLIGIVHDITHQHEREREIAEQNERLEEFTRVVSHDLRNPLNVAQGRLELAKHTDDPEELEAVEEALNRMQELIEELLTLASEGDRFETREVVDLDELAGSCWATVATGSATLDAISGIQLSADPSRLRQLLENLFRNAIEHSGQSATVEVGSCDGGFYVADDGPGIPPKEHDRVFEAGYSTTETGTGFGLSIVEKIASAHGWTLAITESAEGGARFEITGIETN